MTNDALDIYLINMTLADRLLETHCYLLSPEEQVKSQKFLHCRDSKFFCIHKITEKLLLSRYLNCNPKNIKLSHSSYGKPLTPRNIFYSKTHSSEVVVFAFSEYDLGVDIEKMTNLHDNEGLLRDVLHPSEDFSPEEFFKVWTQKEAYLKFIGTGLNVSMNQIKLSEVHDNLIHASCELGYPNAQIRRIVLENFSNFVCHVAYTAGASPRIRFYNHHETLKLF